MIVKKLTGNYGAIESKKCAQAGILCAQAGILADAAPI